MAARKKSSPIQGELITTPPPVPADATPALAPEIAAFLQHAASETTNTPAQRLSAGAIARTLQEVAELLQLTNANTFKVRAYENASRALAGLGEDLDELLAEKKLDEVPGIGSSIAEKVATLATTGKLPYLEELRSQVPTGLVELLRIPGLGPKKAKALFEGLGIATIEELEAACRAGRLGDLRGFGPKTAENLLLGIEQLRRVRGTFLWGFAHAIVMPVVEALRLHPDVSRIEYAGSLRRAKETVHDVDILLATDAPEVVMATFAHGPWAARVLGQGETKTSVVHPSGLQMDLRAVTPVQYPYALHHFTGSKEHNISMRGRAIRMGLKMNEYGLFRGEELIACASEKELFAALGLAFIPPELREDQGEIEAAESGELPARLLEATAVHGALHVHTSTGLGRATLAEMVAGAQALGWEWIGISDHGPGAEWTRGLDRAGLVAQHREVEALQKRTAGIEILHGVEVEILPDGQLALDRQTLATFDFVIAAVHSGLGLDREAQTQRLVRAVESGSVAVLAHPTSRILGERSGIDFDLQPVLEAAARHRVAVEINAHPHRMDLDGIGARAAHEHGVLVSIGPDAHDVAGLENVRLGVGVARRGWLETQDVLNTRTAAEVRQWLRRQA